MSVIVIATAKPLAGYRDEMIAEFEAAVARVHAGDEGGCELYALREDKDRLVMIEKWADGAALAAHSKGEAVASLGAALEGKLDGPLDVHVLRPRPAGTAEQGAL
jgi:quinol monooxygenase YgiN